jgi:hypothetical protein
MPTTGLPPTHDQGGPPYGHDRRRDGGATISQDTSISLGGLRLIVGLVGTVLALALGGNAYMAGEMRTDLRDNVEAVTGLKVSVGELTVEVREARRSRESDVQILRDHVADPSAHRGVLAPIEGRVTALEGQMSETRATVRDVETRLRDQEKKRD